jgi:hypothetical protein
MKGKISKILGIGLSAGLILGLIGAVFAAPVSADLMKWGIVNTPSWEDNVIVPGADIYDYAVGGEDGNTIHAVGAIKGGDDGMTPDYSYLAGVTGSFYISSGSITVEAISADVANFTGDLNGWPCVLTGAFSAYIELSWDADASSGYAIISGEVTSSKMTFSGKLYLTSGSLPTDGDYDCDEEPICIEDNQIQPTTIAMDDFTILNDGDTHVSVYYQPRVWKSTDGGVTWDDITAKVQAAANLPNPFFAITNVAVAPDDEDWLALGGHDVPFHVHGMPQIMVVASKDGGGNFAYTGDLEDTTNGTQFGSLRDIAISPEVDGIHNIALAGSSVYRLQAGTWLGGSWEDTSFYNGWDSGVAYPPTWIVVALAFSPNFDIDDTIVCLGWDDTVIHYPYLQSGTWEASGGAWNDAGGFPQAVKITDDGDTLNMPVTDPETLDDRRSLGLALPADYDGSDPGARTVFAYVDAENLVTGLVGGYVFRIDNASVGPAFGPRGEPLLASIAFHGDADTGKMMVGTYVGWDQDLDEPIQPDCCAGVAVYHTEELDPCCPAWEGSCKDPSGPFMALVSYTPDGEKAYATTSGFIVDYSWYEESGIHEGVVGGIGDESAFSVSRDDGVSWNQLGLIDTDIDYLSDVAVCPDCGTIYLSTINTLDCWTCSDCDVGVETFEAMEVCEVCQCDSVWRSYDDGDTWERVYHGNWVDDPTDELLLRLPCDAVEDCCDQDSVSPSGTLYLGIKNYNNPPDMPALRTIFYTRDCGQCWNEPPATKIDIQDFCVESENIVYVIDTSGYFSMSTQYGRRWSDAVDTGVGSGHTIACCCDQGFVVVGGDGDDPVAWSDDGGENWNLTDDLPGESYQRVHVACDPVCENVIYAALCSAPNVGGIYRTDVTDGSWTDLNAEAFPYYGIVVAREGTLYAASYAIGVDESKGLCDEGRFTTSGVDNYYSGVARNLDPCETACCGTEDWDYLICGLTGNSVWNSHEKENFTKEPSALRICGCLSIDTNSVLWAIDYDDYDVAQGLDGSLWSYEDCAAKLGPTLTSPADGSVLDCEPCAGCDAANFTLKWERMCEACSYDIQIMDETGNVIVEWTDQDITGDPPSLFVDGTLDSGYYYLECGMTYTWHVREANTSCECVHSPWSETWTFTVAVGAADAIQLLAPTKGALDVPIQNIGFSWTSVRNATSYSFVLSPNANLTGALVSQDMSTTAFNYVGPLDYSKAYYWQIIAWEDGTRLTTSSIGVFNTMAEPVEPTPPVVVEQQPAPVINIPAAEKITPTWIYAIIGIGAALAVVVIVLIVRTRRP